MTDRERIEKIVAEIERRKKEIYDAFGGCISSTSFLAEYNLLTVLRCFINELPSEPPYSDNIEQEVINYTNRHKEECYGRKALVYDVARHFAAWQLEQMIKGTVNGDAILEGDGYGENWGLIVSDEFHLDKRGLKDKDKVKLIIIK